MVSLIAFFSKNAAQIQLQANTVTKLEIKQTGREATDKFLSVYWSPLKQRVTYFTFYIQ